MQVQAIARGYFGKLVEVGEVFDVPDDAKASWFVAVADGGNDEDKPQQGKTKAKPKTDASAD